METEENILISINQEEEINQTEEKNDKEPVDEFINKLPDWDLMPPNTPIRRVSRVSW